MAGRDGTRLGAVVDRGTVAARIERRQAPLAVPAAPSPPPAATAAAPPSVGAAGFLTAEVHWDGAGDLDPLAVAAFALTCAARAEGPVRLGMLDGGRLGIVEAAADLRLGALAAALDAAPAGTGATVSLTAGGDGASALPPPPGAGWAVLTVGRPAMRPCALPLAGDEWGVGVARLGTLTLAFHPTDADRAAALLDRVCREIGGRDWRSER